MRYQLSELVVVLYWYSLSHTDHAALCIVFISNFVSIDHVLCILLDSGVEIGHHIYYDPKRCLLLM